MKITDLNELSETETKADLVEIISETEKISAPNEITAEEDTKQHKKQMLAKEIREYAITFIVTLAILLFINSVFIINARIPSASMENTVMTGDRIIGNRLAYKNHIPNRFDIIIFRYPDDESQLFIKRVIGLPGDTVYVMNGKVYINDAPTPLDDSFTKEAPYSLCFGPYYVPSNCYFVMGDNRNNSLDSRYWKNTFVNENQILGKAVFRYYPFTKIGLLK